MMNEKCPYNRKVIRTSPTWIQPLEIFDSKVKQLFVMIVFDTFDELMLHHDVCSLSFSEIHTWIKKSIGHT
jgi:hypothetical protein